MRSKHKSLQGIIITVIGILCLGLLGYLHFTKQVLPPVDGYIYDKNAGITLKEVSVARRGIRFENQTNLKPAPADSSPQTIVDNYFSGGVINVYTVKYFKFLERLFKKSKDFKTHLAEVRAYLFSQFPEEEALKLFGVYQKYLECEMALAEQFSQWPDPQNPEDILAWLNSIQDFRRKQLGGLADKLFGPEIKGKEYAVRRGSIVNDVNLYGPEKEVLLKELNADMWGDEADAVENYSKPYNRYQEKLQIYALDLQEITDEQERKLKIKEFREQLFDSETIAKLEKVDQQMVMEKDKIADYYAAEETIKNDPDLEPDEKQEQIKTLQDHTFGEQADAFRRRDKIRMDKEKLIQGTKFE